MGNRYRDWVYSLLVPFWLRYYEYHDGGALEIVHNLATSHGNIASCFHFSILILHLL